MTPKTPEENPSSKAAYYAHPAAFEPHRLLADCDVRRQRRSGPGGQHRNKVETAVVLVHRPSGIRAQGSERRSQELNRRAALFRLRIKLALEIRLPVDFEAEFKPSELWRSRCRNERLSVNANHEDFPALLAEALDVVTARKFDVKAASEMLGCTASQLTKFFRIEPMALNLINQHREQLGLHPIR